MKLALQLSCYNGSRYLPTLFASLEKQTWKDFTLFFTDNASAPEERARMLALLGAAKFKHQVITIDPPNIGFANAHNKLFSALPAETQYVQLVNDDAFLEPEYLERVVAYMDAHPECSAVGGKILRWNFEERNNPNAGRTHVIDSLGIILQKTSFMQDKGSGEKETTVSKDPQKVFGISGCLPLYRVSAIKKVAWHGQLFHPLFFMYKEDCELAHRLHRAGWQAVTLPQAVAYHRRGYGTKSFLRPKNQNAYFSYRNHLWILFLHMHGKELWQRPLTIGAEIAKALYWLIYAPSFILRAIKETAAQRKTLMADRREFQARLKAPKNLV